MAYRVQIPAVARNCVTGRALCHGWWARQGFDGDWVALLRAEFVDAALRNLQSIICQKSEWKPQGFCHELRTCCEGQGDGCGSVKQDSPGVIAGRYLTMQWPAPTRPTTTPFVDHCRDKITLLFCIWIQNNYDMLLEEHLRLQELGVFRGSSTFVPLP